MLQVFSEGMGKEILPTALHTDFKSSLVIYQENISLDHPQSLHCLRTYRCRVCTQSQARMLKQQESNLGRILSGHWRFTVNHQIFSSLSSKCPVIVVLWQVLYRAACANIYMFLLSTPTWGTAIYHITFNASCSCFRLCSPVDPLAFAVLWRRQMS